MKNILTTLIALFCYTLSHSQNVKMYYSEKEYPLDSVPAGVPMFTYPLTVLNNGNVLAVTSYEKKYINYVYLSSEGKELFSGKVEFKKFPKYSAYIYKFTVHENIFTGYSIIQEKVQGKEADVLYRYSVDMSSNQLIAEEAIATRSLAGNKLGTLTVFPDENNQSVTIFKCTHPEKNKFVFDVTVLNEKNTVILEKQLEYINDDLKGMTMNIQTAKFINNKYFICSMEAVNNDITKSSVMTMLIDIKHSKASLKELLLGKLVTSYGMISHYPGQDKLTINYSVITDEKTNYFTSTNKKYYNFYTVRFDLSTGELSEPFLLPIQKTSALMTEITKHKDLVKDHIFPINFLMNQDGTQVTLMSESFDGMSKGDDMNVYGFYYSDPRVAYWHPKTIGAFVIDDKGKQKETIYARNFEYESSSMFDLASSKNGYYILNQSPVDETIENDKTQPKHYYAAIHIANDGKATRTLLAQNPNNCIENMYYRYKSSPYRNPSSNDGYHTDYNRNNNRNIFCYRIKNSQTKTFKYVWIKCE